VALAVGDGDDLPLVQLAVGLAELSVGRGEGFIEPEGVLLVGGVDVGEVDVVAVLRGGGFGELFGGVLVFDLANLVLLGRNLFILNIILGVDGGRDVGETASDASRLVILGVREERFVVGG
jgi:hypothetical protein